jgi:hypothetical protein
MVADCCKAVLVVGTLLKVEIFLLAQSDFLLFYFIKLQVSSFAQTLSKRLLSLKFISTNIGNWKAIFPDAPPNPKVHPIFDERLNRQSIPPLTNHGGPVMATPGRFCDLIHAMRKVERGIDFKFL